MPSPIPYVTQWRFRAGNRSSGTDFGLPGSPFSGPTWGTHIGVARGKDNFHRGPPILWAHLGQEPSLKPRSQTGWTARRYPLMPIGFPGRILVGQAGRPSAGRWPILRFFLLESGRNLARKPDYAPEALLRNTEYCHTQRIRRSA